MGVPYFSYSNRAGNSWPPGFPGHQRGLRAPHLLVGALHAAPQLDGPGSPDRRGWLGGFFHVDSGQLVEFAMGKYPVC